MTVYCYINANIERIKREARLGIVPVTILRQWQVYSRYDALRKTQLTVTDAVALTADSMRCCESTVYKVIRKMEQKI